MQINKWAGACLKLWVHEIRMSIEQHLIQISLHLVVHFYSDILVFECVQQVSDQTVWYIVHKKCSLLKFQTRTQRNGKSFFTHFLYMFKILSFPLPTQPLHTQMTRKEKKLFSFQTDAFDIFSSVFALITYKISSNISTF